MASIDATVTRPIMRYYGGKWRIAPAIVAAMPRHAVYVEPFGGGGSVLLRKARATCEVYNDLYADVVNVFRQLRDNGQALIQAIEMTPYARDEHEEAYEATEDALEAARRFVFRSAAGIGSDSAHRWSGFRTSLDDARYSSAKSWAALPESLMAVVRRLQGVIIENRPAMEVMAQYDAPHALHYVDPPYAAVTRKACRPGYAHELQGEDQHAELLTFLRGLRGRVMLSGYPCDLYDNLLRGWHKVAVKGGRDQVNARTNEVLWMNFRPEGELL